jgi:hypothetical protein
MLHKITYQGGQVYYLTIKEGYDDATIYDDIKIETQVMGPGYKKVEMTRLINKAQFKFAIHDDGGGILGSSLIQEYSSNRYMSYVAKKGQIAGTVYVNETQVEKDEYSSIMAKTYRIES